MKDASQQDKIVVDQNEATFSWSSSYFAAHKQDQ